jgi:hypothetical protein
MKRIYTLEGYLEGLSVPLRAIVLRLRTIILTQFPAVEETVMGEGLWYQGFFYIASVGDHVNLGVSIKGLPAAAVSLFEGTGKTQRHLKFFDASGIDEAGVVEKLRMVYTMRD